MIINGPYLREITVSVPIGDSRRLLGEYRAEAENLVVQTASRFGYLALEVFTEHKPEERLIEGRAMVEVFDYFEDEEEEWN